MALIQLSAETITVSTTAIGITESLRGGNIITAVFQHRAGGRVNGLASAVPDLNGGNGEFDFGPGDSWEVVGFQDIRDFKMVKQNGLTDATIEVQLLGRPA